MFRSIQRRLHVVLLVALVPALATAEVVVYRITDIGDLPGGDDYSESADINNQGEVVGVSFAADGVHGFLWNINEGMQDLGQISVSGINDSTTVVGTASSEAALWNESDGIQGLGFLPDGDAYSNGRGINNSGQVVGLGLVDEVFNHAFLWDSVNGMQDLGTLVGADGNSYGDAVNQQGQVVGQSTVESGGDHAMLWDSTNGMQDLGILPSTLDDTSAANDINDAGEVVGTSGERAFLWDSENGMRELGVLPDGENWSYGNGINNAGQVVGVSGKSGWRAVLWNNGSIIDLNDAIDASDPLAPHVTLSVAMAINDAGQIAAAGTDTRTGASRAYLLSPVDLVLDLVPLTDVNGNGSSDLAVLASKTHGEMSENTVYVADGLTGDPISQKTVLDDTWRGLDLVAPGGASSPVVGVLAQKTDNLITVAVHRAADGSLVRKIPFFGRGWTPVRLEYVPNAGGPGGSAFAVLAQNNQDDRLSVQLRRRSDGSLLRTIGYFLEGWEALDLEAMGDMTNNNRPELAVLAQSEPGQIVALVKDAGTTATVNEISYFTATTTARVLTAIDSIGAGSAPEMSVLGDRIDGRHFVQSRDALTDALVNNLIFFTARWNAIDARGLRDVNGNSSSDMAVLAQNPSTGAVLAQVRDAVSGELIRNVPFLGPSYDARALAVFNDIDGNGVQELGVAGIKSGGGIRIQIKDALSGSSIRTINIQ